MRGGDRRKGGRPCYLGVIWVKKTKRQKEREHARTHASVVCALEGGFGFNVQNYYNRSYRNGAVLYFYSIHSS